MANKTIFTIGFQLPTKDNFIYKSFHSNASLLDADIILFESTLDYKTDYYNATFEGKPNLSDESSVQCLKSMKHWRDEITIAFNSGEFSRGNICTFW